MKQRATFAAIRGRQHNTLKPVGWSTSPKTRSGPTQCRYLIAQAVSGERRREIQPVLLVPCLGRPGSVLSAAAPDCRHASFHATLASSKIPPRKREIFSRSNRQNTSCDLIVAVRSLAGAQRARSLIRQGRRAGDTRTCRHQLSSYTLHKSISAPTSKRERGSSGTQITVPI